MNVFDKFLLVFYTFGVMIALFVIALVAAGWTTPLEAIQVALLGHNERLILGILLGLFLLISFRFFLWGLSRECAPAQAVVHESGMGQVRVSVDALQNLIYKVANQIHGVREVKPRVVCHSEGVNIFIKVVLAAEVNIPQTTDEIQTKVRDYINELVGIKVDSVKILVDSIASESKTAVSRKLS